MLTRAVEGRKQSGQWRDFAAKVEVYWTDESSPGACSASWLKAASQVATAPPIEETLIQEVVSGVFACDYYRSPSNFGPEMTLRIGLLERLELNNR
jgi:hypothetical protein